MRHFLLMLGLFWTLALHASPAPAAPLAAGDRTSLWVVMEKGDQFQLLYRATDTPAGTLYVALQNKRKVVGLVASQSFAYLLYDNHILQSIQFVRDSTTGSPAYDIQQLPPLPDGVKTLDMNAGPLGLLMLTTAPSPAAESASSAATSNLYTRSENEHWWFQTPSSTKTPKSPPPAAAPQQTGKPRGAKALPGTGKPRGAKALAGGTKPGGEKLLGAKIRGAKLPGAKPSGAKLPGVVIYQLHRGQWLRLSAPIDLDPKSQLRIATLNHQPAILHYAAGSLTLYQFDGSTWTVQHDAMKLGTDWRVLNIDHHLVLIARRPRPQGNGNQLVARLRFNGKWLNAGVMELPAGRRLDWMPTSYDDQLTVVLAGASKPNVAGTSPALSWIQRDLRGKPDALVKTVTLKITPRPAPTINRELMMFGLFAVAMLIMMTIWRRDTPSRTVKLPPTMVPVELTRRGLALTIDLIPAWGVIYLLQGLTDAESLFQHWPNFINSSELYLSLLVIGVMTVHVTLSEMFTGRSLGKWIMGCRVVTLTGRPPNIWQVLVRNVIRILELPPLIWPLIFLAAINASHQRLGDMAARTVVVRDAKPGETTSEKQANSDE